MSLTGELKKKDSPVTRWFEEWLPNLAPVSKEWYAKVKPVPIIRPDTERSVPGTVGTAFDYRLRYYFAATPLEKQVAATGMRLVDARRRIETQRAAPEAFFDLYGAPPAAAGPVADLLLDFRERLDAFLAEVDPAGRELDDEAEQLLCRYCYVLAWFDEPFRAGLLINSPLYTLPSGATVDDLLALPEQIWSDDLVTLSRLFGRNSYAEFARREVILNPRVRRQHQNRRCRRRSDCRPLPYRGKDDNRSEVLAQAHPLPAARLRFARLRRRVRDRRRWRLPLASGAHDPLATHRTAKDIAGV